MGQPHALYALPHNTQLYNMSGKGAKGLSGKGLSGKGAKGTMKGGDKKKPTSRSVKAGLQFPVGRIHRFLKNRAASGGRVGATAAVYSAAILEYLTAEELDTLIKATIAGGGVIPHIHKSLINKSSKKSD